MKKLLVVLVFLLSFSVFGNNQAEQEPAHNYCPLMNDQVIGDYDFLLYGEDRRLIEKDEHIFQFEKIEDNSFQVVILHKTGEQVGSMNLSLTYNPAGYGCEVTDIDSGKLFHFDGMSPDGTSFAFEELVDKGLRIKSSGKRLVFYPRN